jgi:hypothetical protein
MMTIARRLLIGMFVFFGSIGLTKFWGDYPDTFPRPLQWLGLRFIDLFDRKTPEDTADLEQLFVLGVSLIIVSLATWLVLIAVKRLGHKLPN